MTRLDSKAGLLATIREERENIARLVDKAGKRLEQPGATGDWTLKDVLAHLNGWRWRSVARLEAALAGIDTYHTIWPRELEDADDYESINQWLYEQYRNTPADEVTRESNETFDRLDAAVSALSEEALFTPGRYSWLGDEALGPAVIGGVASHFHDEHEADLRTWLA
jgi:hypothetical protein